MSKRPPVPSAPGAGLAHLGRPSPHRAEELVTIGKLTRPHGLRGEISCLILTDFPERFEETEEVHLVCQGVGVRLVELEWARPHHGRLLVKLAGVDSLEQAEGLRQVLLAVPEDELVELEEGEFYHFELEGLRVIDEQGLALGVLDSVLATPAHEIYAVRQDDGTELLIPAVPDYVLGVDREAGLVRLRRPVFDE